MIAIYSWWNLCVFKPDCSRLRILCSIDRITFLSPSCVPLFSTMAICNSPISVWLWLCTRSFSSKMLYSSSLARPRASQALMVHCPVASSTNGDGPRSAFLYLWWGRLGGGGPAFDGPISNNITNNTNFIAIPSCCQVSSRVDTLLLSRMDNGPMHLHQSTKKRKKKKRK